MSKTALMDVLMVFLCVSLGNSTVRPHDSLGNRCACSEAGFSNQSGNHARGVYYRRSVCFYAFFVGERTQCKRYS